MNKISNLEAAQYMKFVRGVIDQATLNENVLAAFALDGGGALFIHAPVTGSGGGGGAHARIEFEAITDEELDELQIKPVAHQEAAIDAAITSSREGE
ncbi:MAG TPA: hypothetical protein VJ654_00645 [Noviherbaspirillum sp.]|nr:hypothetical protein [Noviherbaspirillum sp.]